MSSSSFLDDDDRTRMPGRMSPAPPDPPPNRGEGHNALPVGTRLDEFEIVGIIGEGGFGIVYRVYDHSLQRNVAVKEYMPSSFAGRFGGSTVAVRSERHSETFNAGLRSFINEARLLAQFDHPSLLKVYRFWEGNGTGYFVMPYYDGSVTLRHVLTEQGAAPSEAWLMHLLTQLLDALEVLHTAKCFHRDISPDNILLLADGRPLLLDFGAARRVIGDMTQALTVFLKPGYAPMEQYADDPSLKQGPWTDLYALAAVIYFAITRKAPVPSVARIVSDSLVPASQAGAGRYSARFLAAIDAALAVRPEDRPRTVGEFRHLLGLEAAQSPHSVAFDAPASDLPRVQHRAATPTQTTRSIEPPPAETREPRSRWWIGPSIAAVLLAAVIAGAGWWALNERDRIRSATTNAPDTTIPPPAIAPAEPPTTPTTTTVPQTVPQMPASPRNAESSIASAPPETPAVQKVYDPVRMLDDVFAGRDPARSVSVSVAKAEVVINQDLLRFTVTSREAGYLYILAVGTESDFLLLFPNSIDGDARIEAGQSVTLPRDQWPLRAKGPAGADEFLAIVAENKRSFGSLGARPLRLGANVVMQEFPRDAAARRYRTYTGSTPMFAGVADCAAEPCSQAYGAARFTIREVP